MSGFRFLQERALSAASRRRETYGLEPPGPVDAVIRRDPKRVGVFGAIQLLFYIAFGSPRDMFALFWRYLSDRDTPNRRVEIEGLAERLCEKVSPEARVCFEAFERRNYSLDMATVPSFLERLLHRTTPHLALQPRNEGDIQAAFAFAREEGLSVFPRGISSSAFGGAKPTRNGLVIDLSPLDRLLSIDAENLQATAQPGLRWADFAEALKKHGLAPVTTPSSRFSTLGGWMATGGWGMDAFGYGPFSNAVLHARAVLPTGDVLEISRENGKLGDFIGTEGQLGIVTEMTVKVRKLPHFSHPRLLYFDHEAAACDFVDRLVQEGFKPSHLSLFDANYMDEENRLFRDRMGFKELIVREHPAVLAHFDDEDEDKRFGEWLDTSGFESEPNRVEARFLWSERFFPLKAQRLGPNLLAAEVLMPRLSIPTYLQRLKRLAGRFGVHPAVEVLVTNEGENSDCVTIASFPCDSGRSINYMLKLLLVQLLTRLAVHTGGKPYGIGLWNTPFVHRRIEKKRFERLENIKRKIDPSNMLNPMKFFAFRTRIYNIAGLFFHPVTFDLSLWAATACAPVLGLFCRLTSGAAPKTWEVPNAERKRALLHETAQRCTSCGACVSVCPAYRLTKDERVTGRAKLRMAMALARGEDISEGEAFSPFQCLRCGLCEEVCQTRLPLTDCYLALEAGIRERFGSPDDTIERFTWLLDDHREEIMTLYGLYFPEWKPGESRRSIPQASRLEGGER